jgi:hypothetical protein
VTDARLLLAPAASALALLPDSALAAPLGCEAADRCADVPRDPSGEPAYNPTDSTRPFALRARR